jgi:predicted site-specific integrase-resolvase
VKQVYEEFVLDLFLPHAEQDTRSTVVYARVTSHDQKEDLKFEATAKQFRTIGIESTNKSR